MSRDKGHESSWWVSETKNTVPSRTACDKNTHKKNTDTDTHAHVTHTHTRTASGDYNNYPSTYASRRGLIKKHTKMMNFADVHFDCLLYTSDAADE